MPSGIITCCAIVAGWQLLRRKYRSSVKWFGLIIIIAYGISTPVTSLWLFNTLQVTPQSIPQQPDLKSSAIVILGVGWDELADGTVVLPKPGGARVKTGALLAQKTKLKILVSGGRPKSSPKSEAQLMTEELVNKFKIKPHWQEDVSINTWENAIYSAKLLKASQITTVYLVTQQFHLPRAMTSFQQQGLRVIPVPALLGVELKVPQGWRAWLPDIWWLKISSLAWHEYVGILWYRLSYYAKFNLR